MGDNGAFGSMTAAAEIGVEEQRLFAEQQGQLRAVAGMALRISGAVLTGAAYLAPPVVGAVTGLTHPVHVEFAPGLEADAQVQGGSATAVDLGIVGGGTLPAAHTRYPLIGDLSGSIRMQPFALPDTQDTNQLGLYAALSRNPAASITDPIATRAEANAVKGVAVGLLADVAATGVFVGGGLAWRRRRQAKQDAIDRAVARHEAELSRSDLLDDPALESSWTGISQALEPEREAWSSRKRRLAGAAAALALIGGSATLVHHELRPQTVCSADETALLDPELAAASPALSGAGVCGSGAQYLVNTEGKAVLRYKTATDTTDAHDVRAVGAEVRHLKQTGQLFYLKDPNYVAVADISDVHCNLAYMSGILPSILHDFNVRVVMNTGDTDVSTGVLPFESQCVNAMTDALRPTAAYPGRIDEVVSDGNHDSSITAGQMRRATIKDLDGHSYHPYTILDSDTHYHATIAGLTFVGSSDGRRSVAGTPIQPNPPEEQAAMVAKQGANLADVSCSIEEKTGISPIVLSHDPRAGYAAVARGCATLATSGHLHHQTLPEAFPSLAGETAYLFNQGTSSGVEANHFTEYTPPLNDAPVTIFIIDKLTNRPLGYYNVMLHKDTAPSPIAYQPMPSPSSDSLLSSRLYGFLQSYDPETTASLDSVRSAADDTQRPKAISAQRKS